METTKHKIVVCPDCGADLKNAPHLPYACCPSCASTRTFPRFTEPERTESKRAVLPVAERLKCHDTWWTIAGQAGIWGAKFDKSYPGVIKAKIQANGGNGWSVEYFGRLKTEEAELRAVFGAPAVEDRSEATNG